MKYEIKISYEYMFYICYTDGAMEGAVADIPYGESEPCNLTRCVP